MRRILHIIDSLGHIGTAKQLLVLSRGLARQGFDVHICALTDPPNSIAKIPLPFRKGLGEDSSANLAPCGGPISFTALGRRWPIDPLADWQLRRLVVRLKPDIVHTWDTVAGMFGATTVGRTILSVLPTRTDKIVRSTRPHVVAGHYRIQRWPPAWDSFFERRFAPQVAHFVTNSKTVRDWCVCRGLPANNFTVIPSGVPGATMAHDSPCAIGSASALNRDGTREKLLHELRLPLDAKLIGVVGRLVPDKRVQDLIWAADLLRVLHDNLRLLVIGDGPDRQQLERYARLASDLEHIRFLGERDDVAQIMPHLDVLWNGSENRGQSMAIVEAMAAGVPVIASDTPSNRELVVEGETGFLIPLGSRAGRAARARNTDRIFTDVEMTARMGAAAQRRAGETFSSERMVDQNAELYSKTLGLPAN